MRVKGKKLPKTDLTHVKAIFNSSSLPHFTIKRCRVKTLTFQPLMKGIKKDE